MNENPGICNEGQHDKTKRGKQLYPRKRGHQMFRLEISDAHFCHASKRACFANETSSLSCCTVSTISRTWISPKRSIPVCWLKVTDSYIWVWTEMGLWDGQGNTVTRPLRSIQISQPLTSHQFILALFDTSQNPLLKGYTKYQRWRINHKVTVKS